MTIKRMRGRSESGILTPDRVAGLLRSGLTWELSVGVYFMNFIARILSSRPIAVDVGLLIVRLGVGLITLTIHGWGKISGGPDLWARLGNHMGNLGITFLPTFWGFMAGFAEFGCSILLILGIFFRPAATLLAFTMLVAALRHLNLPADEARSGWSGASHALELLAVYLGLLFAGPGRYALANFLRRTSDGE